MPQATAHPWQPEGRAVRKRGPEGPEEKAKRNPCPHFSDEATEALQGGFYFAVISS